MKTQVIESTTIDNIIVLLWAVFIISGCSYLVFWRNESGWWFILAILLLSASVYHKKVTTEQ